MAKHSSALVFLPINGGIGPASGRRLQGLSRSVGRAVIHKYILGVFDVLLQSKITRNTRCISGVIVANDNE